MFWAPPSTVNSAICGFHVVELSKIKGANIGQPRFWCLLKQSMTPVYSLLQASPVSMGKIQVAVASSLGLVPFSAAVTTGLTFFTKGLQGTNRITAIESGILRMPHLNSIFIRL